MHILEVTFLNRNDFHFIAYCRHCQKKSRHSDGYADAFYQEQVFPHRHCEHCGFDEYGDAARPDAADSAHLQEDAKSLAQMIVEWVDGGITMNLDWRPRLASVIEKRLRRLQNEHAIAVLSARPDLRRSE